MVRRSSLPALIASAALAIVLPAGATLQGRATLEIIASNLANPRGLNFGPEGALYVAEAGSGGPGCFAVGPGQNICYGTTGAVTRITDLDGSPAWSRVVTGLPSVARTMGTTGPHDVEFQGRGNGYVTIGLGTNPEERVLFQSIGANLGRLVRFQPNGQYSFEEDLAEFELDEDPDRVGPDSNPYGLVALPGRQVYVDAGGNALNAVAANGAISTLAVFPPGETPGGVSFQAVPTSVALNADGDFYVGQLTGFPFPGGRASVYRVPANGGSPTEFATGFTKIIDVTVGPDGWVYVLQLSTSPGAPPPAGTGSLIRVSPDGSMRETVVGPDGGLVAPGGIAIAADGSIYLTNRSTSPTAGSVVRVIP
jgi:hypothetical protein